MKEYGCNKRMRKRERQRGRTERRNERVRFEIFATVARGLPWAISARLFAGSMSDIHEHAFPLAVHGSERDPPASLQTHPRRKRCGYLTIDLDDDRIT